MEESKKTDTNLTVIMSVRNNEATIKESLDSLFFQTYSSFKVIVIDDASTDSTPQILDKYKQNHGNLTVIKNNQSQGLAINLNTMIDMADTDFIARMDGDDICYPDRFEKQMVFLKNNPFVDILGTSAHIIDDKGRKSGVLKWPLSHKDIVKVIWANPVIHPSVIFKREKIVSIGGYPLYKRRQDYALWFRAVKKGLVFANLPDFCIQYRIVKKHYRKASFINAFTQMKIGWIGYAAIGGLNPKAYVFMAWPVVRSFLPSSLQRRLQKYLRKFDPRRKKVKV